MSSRRCAAASARRPSSAGNPVDALFGISMNAIMVGLLVLLGITLSTIAYVFLRNRIMFMIGLRNIPRRPAQTVLIILGLMLSTLIISAAFTTGDTVDHSLGAQAYRYLGHLDVMVQQEGESEGGPEDIDSTLDAGLAARLRENLDPEAPIDGVAAVLIEQVPVINPRSRQSDPTVNFVGLEAGALEGFPDLVSSDGGDVLDVATLGPEQAYMNESAADELAAERGDTVQVFVQGQPHEFEVVEIVEDRLLSGVGDFDSTEGMVTRLDTLQGVLDRDGLASFLAVSAEGGVRDTVGLTDDVEQAVRIALAASGSTAATLDTYDVKRDFVGIAEEAGNFMATFFLIFGLFSIAAGMLLIVMIFVMLAAERKSELGMARAIGTKRSHLVQMFMSEGMAYNLLAALVGTALGVAVAIGIANVMARIFSEFNISIEPYVTPRSLNISYSLGVSLTFVTVVFGSWRVSNLNIVRAIRDLPEPINRQMGRRWLIAAVVGLVAGALLIYLGLTSNTAFPFALGFSVVAASMAVLLRFFGFPERPVFTAMGLLLLVLWGFTAGNRLEFLFGELRGDFEMFFLSGIAMVTAATFVLVYNADLMLAVLARVGGSFGTVLPAMKTAVSYPLASKFRTGMTLAMISLVIFALTMMSTMNLNFDRLFLADSARGGWDVQVDENPANPLDDLGAALAAADSSVADQFRAVGRARLAAESRVAERALAGPDFKTYPIVGVDEGFVRGGSVPLSARAEGFESDEEVWQALAARNDVAVVDGFTVEGGGFSFDDVDAFTISGIDADAGQFEPIELAVRNGVTGATAPVEVIGVIEFGASASFFGIYVPDQTFQQVFGEPLLTRHVVGLQDPEDAKEVARQIEAALLPAGAQAESIKERIDGEQAAFRNFFLLMQAFTGLGLFVGIAAVGVIAFRTVVERRQQIGMLRAIGYRRGTVALSFLLESSFITLLGVAAGVGLAIWLSYFLITSDEFPTSEGGYAIPWLRIALISAFAIGASLLMTYIPARQASRVPIAEALRYE
jgi:putative ABC transport system permease protein